MESSQPRRQVVIPGEIVDTRGLKPGLGTYVEGAKILAGQLGIRTEHEGYVDIIPLGGRYIPQPKET